MFLGAVVFCSSVCFASENEVSIRFDGAVAPYAKIEWVWGERDGFGSLGVTRAHAGKLGSYALVALRGEGALAAAADELRGCLSLPHRPPTAGEPMLTLTTELTEEAVEEQTSLAASGAAATGRRRRLSVGVAVCSTSVFQLPQLLQRPKNCRVWAPQLWQT